MAYLYSMRTPCVALILAAFITSSVIGPSPANAQELVLPLPGEMVHLSASFHPPVLKGIKVHPQNPFQFDFIMDKGDSTLSDQGLKNESTTLIKYFMASLTVPEGDLWVNLSPYEKDRIIPESFGRTEMGRDLLAQDYLLKQITSSLIYPDSQLGKQFWNKVYTEAAKKFGNTDIAVNTFNKVWIVPGVAKVYENKKNATAYVVESHLKVMLEEDYLASEKNSLVKHNKGEISSQILKDIIIPRLENEINEGQNFAQLRQVYNSLILAAWYKKKIKQSLLTTIYKDQNKVAGIDDATPKDQQQIYEQYLKAFKKGAYNFIKEETDFATGKVIPRKYFSGGFSGNVSEAMTVTDTMEHILSNKGFYVVSMSLIAWGLSSAILRYKQYKEHKPLLDAAKDTSTLFAGRLEAASKLSILNKKAGAKAYIAIAEDQELNFTTRLAVIRKINSPYEPLARKAALSLLSKIDAEPHEYWSFLSDARKYGLSHEEYIKYLNDFILRTYNSKRNPLHDSAVESLSKIDKHLAEERWLFITADPSAPSWYKAEAAIALQKLNSSLAEKAWTPLMNLDGIEPKQLINAAAFFSKRKDLSKVLNIYFQEPHQTILRILFEMPNYGYDRNDFAKLRRIKDLFNGGIYPLKTLIDSNLSLDELSAKSATLRTQTININDELAIELAYSNLFSDIEEVKNTGVQDGWKGMTISFKQFLKIIKNKNENLTYDQVLVLIGRAFSENISGLSFTLEDVATQAIAASDSKKAQEIIDHFINTLKDKGVRYYNDSERYEVTASTTEVALALAAERAILDLEEKPSNNSLSYAILLVLLRMLTTKKTGILRSETARLISDKAARENTNFETTFKKIKSLGKNLMGIDIPDDFKLDHDAAMKTTYKTVYRWEFLRLLIGSAIGVASANHLSGANAYGTYEGEDRNKHKTLNYKKVTLKSPFYGDGIAFDNNLYKDIMSLKDNNVRTYISDILNKNGALLEKLEKDTESIKNEVAFKSSRLLIGVTPKRLSAWLMDGEQAKNKIKSRLTESGFDPKQQTKILRYILGPLVYLLINEKGIIQTQSETIDSELLAQQSAVIRQNLESAIKAFEPLIHKDILKAIRQIFDHMQMYAVDQEADAFEKELNNLIEREGKTTQKMVKKAFDLSVALMDINKQRRQSMISLVKDAKPYHYILFINEEDRGDLTLGFKANKLIYVNEAMLSHSNDDILEVEIEDDKTTWLNVAITFSISINVLREYNGWFDNPNKIIPPGSTVLIPVNYTNYLVKEMTLVRQFPAYAKLKAEMQNLDKDVYENLNKLMNAFLFSDMQYDVITKRLVWNMNDVSKAELEYLGNAFTLSDPSGKLHELFKAFMLQISEFDEAMQAEVKKLPGGIDLNAADKTLDIKSKTGEEGIRFDIDPAMLAEYENVPGFIPEITSFQPLQSLQTFLQ
jgi:hypothetical protein